MKIFYFSFIDTDKYKNNLSLCLDTEPVRLIEANTIKNLTDIVTAKSILNAFKGGDYTRFTDLTRFIDVEKLGDKKIWLSLRTKPFMSSRKYLTSQEILSNLDYPTLTLVDKNQVKIKRKGYLDVSTEKIEVQAKYVQYRTLARGIMNRVIEYYKSDQPVIFTNSHYYNEQDIWNRIGLYLSVIHGRKILIEKAL